MQNINAVGERLVKTLIKYQYRLRVAILRAGSLDLELQFTYSCLIRFLNRNDAHLLKSR